MDALLFIFPNWPPVSSKRGVETSLSVLLTVKLHSGGLFSKGLDLSGFGEVLKSFQVAGKRSREQTMILRARRPIRILNQIEWYMSNSCRKLKSLNKPGCNFCANSVAPSCWGMMVPATEVMAKIIRRRMVKLTEVKNVQMMFEFFVVLDAAIIPGRKEEIPLAARIAESLSPDIGHPNQNEG